MKRQKKTKQEKKSGPSSVPRYMHPKTKSILHPLSEKPHLISWTHGFVLEDDTLLQGSSILQRATLPLRYERRPKGNV